MPGNKEKSSDHQFTGTPVLWDAAMQRLAAFTTGVQPEALPLVPPSPPRPKLMKTEGLAEPEKDTLLSRQLQWAKHAFSSFFLTSVPISFEEKHLPSQ